MHPSCLTSKNECRLVARSRHAYCNLSGNGVIYKHPCMVYGWSLGLCYCTISYRLLHVINIWLSVTHVRTWLRDLLFIVQNYKALMIRKGYAPKYEAFYSWNGYIWTIHQIDLMVKIHQHYQWNCISSLTGRWGCRPWPRASFVQRYRNSPLRAGLGW